MAFTGRKEPIYKLDHVFLISVIRMLFNFISVSDPNYPNQTVNRYLKYNLRDLGLVTLEPRAKRRATIESVKEPMIMTS